MDTQDIRRRLRETQENKSQDEILKEVNKKRIKYIWIEIVPIYVLFIMFALFMFHLFRENGTLALVFFLISCVLAIYLMVIKNVHITSFQEDYKEKLLEPMIRKEMPEYEYFPYQGENLGYIQRLNILPKADAYRSEDLIQGRCGNIQFSRSDVSIEKMVESVQLNADEHETPSKQLVSVFKGQWIIFEANRIFGNDVLIIEKGINTLGYLKKAYSSVDSGRIEKDTGDEEFDKRFKVYEPNGSKMNATLSRKMMQAITKFSDGTKGKILVYVDGTKVNILINNNIDSLEPNYAKNAREDLKKLVQTLKKEMNQIEEFAKILYEGI